ncbi:MAG TPA: DUF3597 domain-containing protein [Longimicrobium sp.]|jgi:hypothetical protein
MGIFGNILSSLGLGSRPAAPAAPASTPSPAGDSVTGTPGAGAIPAPAPVAVVDVVADLEKRAAAYPGKLNWRYSIVDLLTLLGIDSSYAARKELATELHCPPELMDDSAKMNTWLHKTVLTRIAANGGNIPGDLLD